MTELAERRKPSGAVNPEGLRPAATFVFGNLFLRDPLVLSANWPVSNSATLPDFPKATIDGAIRIAGNGLRTGDSADLAKCQRFAGFEVAR